MRVGLYGCKGKGKIVRVAPTSELKGDDRKYAEHRSVKCLMPGTAPIVRHRSMMACTDLHDAPGVRHPDCSNFDPTSSVIQRVRCRAV